MSEPPESIKRLDTLLIAIFSAPFAVPVIAGAYGLDTRLVWGAIVSYAIWIVAKAFLPGILLSYRERIITEKIKGWSYVIYLGIAFFGNYTLLVILPRTIFVSLFGSFLIALLFSLVYTFVPARLFRREIIYMNKKQERQVHRIWRETGSASIFLAVSILILNLEFVGLEEFSIASVASILASAFFLFIFAVYRERRSSNLTRDLAVSLVNSGWYKKYSHN